MTSTRNTTRTTAGDTIATARHATPGVLDPLMQRASHAARADSGTRTATVIASDGDAWFEVDLDDGQGSLRCRRVASCLLLPALGDTVLITSTRQGDSFVIAVVVQADPRQATLAVDGDLTLVSRSGGIRAHSAGPMALESDTSIAMQSPEWRAQAGRAHCEIGEMDYQGARIRFSVLVSRFVGRTCEVVLDRLNLLTRSSFRLTEEMEQVRAGQIDIQAEQTLRLHSKNTLLTSKGLVKVDAEQIHMG